MEDRFEEISSQLQQGKAPQVEALVRQAVEDGISPEDILEKGLLAGMSVIGEKFKVNEVFVPEVLVAARAMNRGVQVLKPLLAEDGASAKGVAVIGTVKGDLHDIGKNLVKIMMEGKGITMIDLGVDVSPERFVDAAREHKADVICCSALLTTTMGQMEQVVSMVKDSDLAGKIRVMIGGAPVTQAFCEKIGADCYTSDAASAADAALAFCQGA